MISEEIENEECGSSSEGFDAYDDKWFPSAIKCVSMYMYLWRKYKLFN